MIHEWLGIALGIALLLHITLHWDWVVRTTLRLLRPRGPDKLIWLVNLALLFFMTLCVASGILISRVALPELRISLPLLAGPFWDRMHTVTAEVTHHFAPGSFGGQGGPGLGSHQFVVRGQAATTVRRGVKVTPGIHLHDGLSGVPPIQLGDLLQSANLVVLRNTAEIEAAVIAAVVIVDAGRRKLRRARRARASRPSW